MARRKSVLSILVGGKPRYSRKNKPKTFLGMLMEGERRTQKANIPCSKRKYKSSL